MTARPILRNVRPPYMYTESNSVIRWKHKQSGRRNICAAMEYGMDIYV